MTVIGSLSATTFLSSRFTSIVHIYNIDSPDQEDLSIIVTSYLQNLLKKVFQSDNAWPKIKVAKLAGVIQLTYDEIRTTFTPIQQKHYDFGPHDLTRWCRSILRYQKDQSEDSDEMFIVKILYYEAFKLFGETLVNDSSLTKFKQILNSNFQKIYDITKIVSNMQKTVFVPIPQFSKSKSIWDLSMLTMDEWSSTVEKGRVQFERDGGHNMDILMAKDLLHLLSSVSKVLTTDGGHLMMVGQSGMGRRTAVKIASALYSAKLVIPNPGSRYHVSNDWKQALQHAGVEGEDVYLLLEDHMLKGKDILSSLDTLISSGEVPGLFNSTELNSLVIALGDERSRENFEGNLIQFFNHRVKRHLHVIACVDVENEDLQDIFINCSSFIYNSSIIWKNQWSEESILHLPKLVIERLNSRELTVNVEGTQNLPKIFNIIDSKLKNPRKFSQLIQLYIELYLKNISIISSKQAKFKAGITKLNEAKQLVSELKQKAAVQEEKLAEKQKKANAALDMISSTMQNANVHKEKMESLKIKTEAENQQLLKRKKEIEEELSDVEPLIQEARAAVGKIKTESLSEIRSLRAPPEVIRDILEGVLRLMGIQDTSWNSMKNFLSKRGVKEDIRSFDASRIKTENRLAVERLMSMRSESFNPTSAKRASVAAVPLAAWVAANVKYSHVVEKIKPLEKEQYKLKQNLNTAEAQLGELNADLSDVDDTVAKLKSQLSAYTKEAAEIEIDLNQARQTLAKAETMVDKLNDEYERWQEQSKELLNEVQKLPIGCLLSSAVISYLTAESESGRSSYLKKFMEELEETKYDFEHFMSTKRELLQWQGEGLPNDKLSIQNAIMITKSNITPLLIDPTCNALNWAKKNLKDRQIECVTQDAPNFENALELSVRFGKVLFVEEVNKISPLILVVCRKQFIYQGERRLISFNGKLLDYHADFKLILSSRDEHLRIPAYYTAYISVMNFSLTHAGFTEQLISATIKQENPELEERKRELVRKTEELQEQQYQLQKRLLEDMANSSGDILQNTKLIESLNETKATFEAVSKSISEQAEIEKKLEQEYNIYRPLSAFGSASFFAVNEFSKYNILYTISASAYTRIFLKTVGSFQSMLENVEMQKTHLISATYSFSARGIFKEDRIKFGLHLMQRMFPEKIPQIEWKIFLQYSETRTNEHNLPDWIPSFLSSSLQNLQNGLPELFDRLKLEDSNSWKDFMVVENCESRIPNNCKLTDFQKVLLVQALRPDRLYSAICNFLSNFADTCVIDFNQIYKESICSEPILLITTSGNDPTSEIRTIASSIGMDYEEIAMGEGQEMEAISLLKKASKTGQWLILKNLHLVTSWLPILSQNLQINLHENFRLWLVTEPNDYFNSVLAQNSLKVVYEVPKGLKFNIQRTYMNWGSKYVENLNTNSAKIFFVLVCLHAILQERRTFIPQGWSKWYEFSDVDFSTCVKLLEDIWQSNSIQVPWNIIRGICSSAIYGGRIENFDDLAILESYLREYCNDDVLSHRFKPFGMKVSLPSSSDFKDYLKLIADIPSKISPSIYGLPINIERSWQAQKSSEIIRESKKLYISKTTSSKFELDSWCKGLNPLVNLWKKLNQGYDFVKMQMTEIKYTSEESPLSIFLKEEFHQMIDLIKKIHKCFASLNRICKKVAPPSKMDLETGNDLLNYKTPKEWQNIWEGPSEPTKYLRSIFAKTIEMSKWQNENVRDLLLKPILLSTFLHPEAFLASHKVDFSSNHNLPLDQITLNTYWRPGQDDCLILSNLLLEGAVFDGNNLKVGDANTENINKVQNCYITWKEKSISVDQTGSILIPLYFNSSRSKKLTTLRVSCDHREKDKLIQSGVAFFLEI